MVSEALYDTSVWVALLSGEGVEKGLRDLPADVDAVVSPIVLAEMASLEEQGRIEGSLTEMILANARVEDITLDDAIAAGKLHGKTRRDGKGKASMADCLLYCTAQRIGALYVTYDNDLAGKPGVRVLGARGRGKGT